MVGLMLTLTGARAQNFAGNVIGLSGTNYIGGFTNWLSASATNATVTTTNAFCNGRLGALWLSFSGMTNNPSVPAGTGSLSVQVCGSPYAQTGPYCPVIYSPSTTLTNILTVPFNGTNLTTGYIVFDATALGSVEILGIWNTATNMVATNIVANFNWK